MTPERRIQAARVAREIQDDMRADAARFEGAPFDGRTVADWLGSMAGSVAVLAKVVQEMLEDD